MDFEAGSTKRIVWSGRHVLHSAGRSFTAGRKLAEVEFRRVGNWIVGRLQEVSDLFVGPSGNQTVLTEWNRREGRIIRERRLLAIGRT